MKGGVACLLINNMLSGTGKNEWLAVVIRVLVRIFSLCESSFLPGLGRLTINTTGIDRPFAGETINR